MPSSPRRADRVGEAIREEIATFLNGGVKDPRVAGMVTVTAVEITRDLRHARVFVSVLGSEEEKKETEEKKREGSKQGQQYVSNTQQAKEARKEAAALPLKNYDDLSVEDIEKKAGGLSKANIEDLLDYEKQHKNRKTLVEALGRKL